MECMIQNSTEKGAVTSFKIVPKHSISNIAKKSFSAKPETGFEHTVI